MTSWRINATGKPLAGEYTPPGDRFGTHLALLLGSLSVGTTRIRGAAECPETVATRRALAHLGASFTTDDEGWLVVGRREERLYDAEVELDVGPFVGVFELLAGFLCGQGLAARIACRTQFPPAAQAVVNLLSEAGAEVELSLGEGVAELSTGTRPPNGFECDIPQSRPGLKAAMLLAALGSERPCTIHEPEIGPDSCERMMKFMGVALRRSNGTLTTGSGHRIYPRYLKIPGELTAAAPFICAAGLIPDSDLAVTEVSTNPHRSGLLKVLAKSGLHVRRTKTWQYGSEPVSRLHIHPGDVLRPLQVPPSLAPAMVDELPFAALIATQAGGASQLRGADLLRGGLPDRAELTLQVLRSFGADIALEGDMFSINGPARLVPATVQCAGDPLAAYLAATAALLTHGETVIHGVDESADPFPGLIHDLARDVELL
jgi:3-phosphoshikimate 1-carboxyvinyltransferase